MIEQDSQYYDEPAFINASSHIFDFHRTMGVNDKYLLSNGHAKLTCATRYKNWLSDSSNHYVGNNTFLPAFNGIALHHLTAFCQSAVKSDYSYAAQIAIQNKRIPELNYRKETFGSFNSGMILNTQEYKKFLRGAALHLGVKVLGSSLKAVEQDVNSGFIKTIVLDNSQRLPVDLVIDNSGADSKIMKNLLNVNYHDSSGTPNFNTLLTIKREGYKPTIDTSNVGAYTSITANNHGWLEEVSISGTNYFRQSCFSTANNIDTVKEAFLTKISPNLSDKSHIIEQCIRYGQSSQFFHRNCIVIGGAAGYYDSPSISNLILTQRAVTRLLSLFPSKACFNSTINEYNRLTTKDYNEAGDFLMLHAYLASTNDDTTYPWVKTQRDLSDNLQQTIALFECYGRFEDQLNAMIISPTWINLLSMCCRKTANYEPLLTAFSVNDISKFLAKIKHIINERVTSLPKI